MRGASAEETIRYKEAYKYLEATHRARVCAYREDNGRFTEPQLKEAVQTCRQHIIYCGVGSHQQNAIMEISIKELILVSWTLLLHTTKLWPKVVSTIMLHFCFK